jgi:hypothetical protein
MGVATQQAAEDDLRRQKCAHYRQLHASPCCTKLARKGQTRIEFLGAWDQSSQPPRADTIIAQG